LAPACRLTPSRYKFEPRCRGGSCNDGNIDIVSPAKDCPAPIALDGKLEIADAALALAPDSALATSARLLICSFRDRKSRWTDGQAGRQSGLQSGREAYTQGSGHSGAIIYQLLSAVTCMLRVEFYMATSKLQAGHDVVISSSSRMLLGRHAHIRMPRAASTRPVPVRLVLNYSAWKGHKQRATVPSRRHLLRAFPGAQSDGRSVHQVVGKRMRSHDCYCPKQNLPCSRTSCHLEGCKPMSIFFFSAYRR